MKYFVYPFLGNNLKEIVLNDNHLEEALIL